MKTLLLSLLLAGLAIPGLVTAVEQDSPDAQVLTAGFLYHHPDLKHRLLGIEAYEAGDHEAAFREFKRSARWSDKAAQAMVAEMLWKGEGTAVDRAEAYAWMDLAAERKYRSFLGMRERFWAELSEVERERALQVGQAIYAEYGDDIARPRLEARIERGQRQMTGSRVGFVGALEIKVPGPGGWTTINGETYYQDKYWKPEHYFEWQDRVWNAPPAGTVDVGPIATTQPSPLPESERN